jgi:hypothetical protein
VTQECDARTGISDYPTRKRSDHEFTHKLIAIKTHHANPFDANPFDGNPYWGSCNWDCTRECRAEQKAQSFSDVFRKQEPGESGH